MAQLRVNHTSRNPSGHASQIGITDEFAGWNTIPGFPDYEMDASSDIRLKPGKNQALRETYRGPYVRLWSAGRLYTKRIESLFAQAWPFHTPREVEPEQTENTFVDEGTEETNLEEAGIFMSKAKAIQITEHTREFVAQTTKMAEWEVELINGFFMITEYTDGVNFSIMRDTAFHRIFDLVNDEDIKKIQTEQVYVKGKWEK